LATPAGTKTCQRGEPCRHCAGTARCSGPRFAREADAPLR